MAVDAVEAFNEGPVQQDCRRLRVSALSVQLAANNGLDADKRDGRSARRWWCHVVDRSTEGLVGAHLQRALVRDCTLTAAVPQACQVGSK